MHRIDKFECQLSETNSDEMHLDIRITFKIDWFLMLAKRIHEITCKIISGNTDDKVIEHKG